MSELVSVRTAGALLEPGSALVSNNVRVGRQSAPSPYLLEVCAATLAWRSIQGVSATLAMFMLLLSHLLNNLDP